MADTILIAERRWSSSAANVQQAREIARDIVCRYAAEDSGLIELAVGEACANAIEHGSPEGERNEFVLRCFLQIEQTALVFEVEDEGHDPAPLRLAPGQVPDLYSEGGRGLFLINAIMDDVALLSTPHGLNVRMTKRFHLAVPSAAGAIPAPRSAPAAFSLAP